MHKRLQHRTVRREIICRTDREIDLIRQRLAAELQLQFSPQSEDNWIFIASKSLIRAGNQIFWAIRMMSQSRGVPVILSCNSVCLFVCVCSIFIPLMLYILYTLGEISAGRTGDTSLGAYLADGNGLSDELSISSCRWLNYARLKSIIDYIAGRVVRISEWGYVSMRKWLNYSFERACIMSLEGAKISRTGRFR